MADEINDNLKKEAQSSKTIYLFYGEDNFRAYEKLKFWREQFTLKYGDLNQCILDGRDFNFLEFRNMVCSYPFLSEKKLIVIQDLLNEGEDDTLKAVAEFLLEIPEYCIVVFFEKEKPDSRKTLFKTLQKYGSLEEFKYLSSQSLIKWIEERFKKLNCTVDNSKARYLAEMIGPNLWLLDNEIKKIALFALHQKISQQIIDKVISPYLATTIFKLTDALGARKIKEALDVLNILLDTQQSLIAVLFALVAHYRAMIQVKYFLDVGLSSTAIAKKLKKHQFFIHKIASQCSYFSMEEIKFLYSKFLAIDNDLKTGKIKIQTDDATELQRALEVMFVQLA